MIRRVNEQVIWLHGNYTFANRESMVRALVEGRRLLDRNAPRAPLQITPQVVGRSELILVVKVPMFEPTEYASHLFELFKLAAARCRVEARVDVV